MYFVVSRTISGRFAQQEDQLLKGGGIQYGKPSAVTCNIYGLYTYCVYAISCVLFALATHNMRRNASSILPELTPQNKHLSALAAF